MYDLHSHILPGIDDGAADLQTSLDMARAFVDQGVKLVACTPHILPGVYHNTGPQIRAAVVDLDARINDAGIQLNLVSGADNHIVPQLVAGLRAGHLLSIADTRYALIEPPHRVAPARLEELFFGILAAGYVPVLTHPERLTWIENKYDLIKRLASDGVWMQITSGSLRGRFGKRARYWAERMLGDGLVHIVASDAHNVKSRPPDLAAGHRSAERLVGKEEAYHLVVTRPQGILSNVLPSELPAPMGLNCDKGLRGHDGYSEIGRSGNGRGVAGRLRRLLSAR